MITLALWLVWGVPILVAGLYFVLSSDLWRA